MAMLSPTQIPDLEVKPPLLTPQPGQVIIGYERFRHEAECCNCDGLTPTAVILIIFFVLFFWPGALVVCVMEDCREEYQRPVYGFPEQGGAGPPVAVKVQQV
eukprot:TRINITY_DN3542_c0_g1_i1.p4 TRINITY_DN3542_c0_g1~~TRINITY_DN3542_c0_g1_i1.p4  ORF type:complete len:102 (-),score=10.41 TRINITY_DN3542_c0_g1_i1:346-651(-)